MLTISRWVQLIQRARRQGQALGPSRYMEIRFEEFTENPEGVLRNICDTFSIEFDPAMTTAKTRKKTNQFGSQIVARDAVWKSYFNCTMQQKLEAVAGKALSEEGYSVSSEGESLPSRYQLKYWFVVDYIRQGVFEFVNDVRNDGVMRGSSRFLEKTRAALTQLRQIAR